MRIAQPIRRSLRHILPLLFALGWIPSCDDKKVAVGGAATVQEFCASLSRAAVRQQMTCLGGTEAFWTTTYATIYDCPDWSRRVASGTYTYDPAKGAQCLDDITRYGCEESGEVLSCTSAIAGTIPSGAACKATVTFLFSSCSPGNRCKLDTSICGGTCQPVPKVGEACTSTCEHGSGCQSNTGLCVADAGEGQPCLGKTAGACADTLYCEGGTVSTEGICRKKKTSGPCVSAEECANRYRCAGTVGAKTCRKAAWVGDPCAPGQGECYAPYAWCGADGKCTNAKAQEGQACGSANGDYIACAKGLSCSQNTCKKGLPAGSPCEDDKPCTGGSINFCDAKTNLCVSCE